MQHDQKNILNMWHLTLNQSKIRETSSPWTLCQKGKCLQNDAFLPPSMYTYTVYFIFPVLSRKHFQVHRPERPAGDLFCCCRPLHLCFMGHSSNLPAFVRKPIDLNPTICTCQSRWTLSQTQNQCEQVIDLDHSWEGSICKLMYLL